MCKTNLSISALEAEIETKIEIINDLLNYLKNITDEELTPLYHCNVQESKNYRKDLEVFKKDIENFKSLYNGDNYDELIIPMRKSFISLFARKNELSNQNQF